MKVVRAWTNKRKRLSREVAETHCKMAEIDFQRMKVSLEAADAEKLKEFMKTVYKELAQKVTKTPK